MATSLKIQGRVLRPSDGDEYQKALQRNSPLSVLPAGTVVQPAIYPDISAALIYAASQNPPINVAVKGGGTHSSTWSSSDGGMVIDLSNLRKVAVSGDKKSVTIQGGAVWGDVYEECAKAGVDVVGSALWFIGVGGFLLGGGYGPLSGRDGLAVDNMLSATVILADGRILRTSTTEEPDLFWAIRGGGGQFCILVEVTLKAFPAAGPITTGVIVYPPGDIVNVLRIVKEWKETFTGKEKLGIQFSRPAPQFTPVIAIMPFISEDADSQRSKKLLAPFLNGPVKPVNDHIHTVPNMLSVSHAADASISAAPKRLKIRGALFGEWYDMFILNIWARWVEFTERNPGARGSAVLIDLTHPQKIGEVASGDTAVRIRTPHSWVALQGRTDDPKFDGAVDEFLKSTIDSIREMNSELTGEDFGYFISMTQGDEKAEDVFGDNLPRLSRLKAKYDPNNVFRNGIAIPRSALL